MGTFKVSMSCSLSASVAGVYPYALGGGGGYPMHSMPSSLSASVAGVCPHAFRWGSGGRGGGVLRAQYA